MRSAHTVEQVRAAEEPLLAQLPDGVLMQRAAGGLAYAVLDFLGSGYGARVLLLVGAGNNGGDALVAGAMLARRGARVEALLLEPERAHAPGLAALRDAGGRVVDVVPTGRDRPDVVLDGIVGIGGSGGLRPAAARVVHALEGVPFVAVDTPSGVDVDAATLSGPHVRAELTVTFGTLKPAHLVDPAAAASGTVHLVDIGLDLPAAGVEALQAGDVARLLPRPQPAAHKYTRGVVGVRAGSAQYPGAGVLCVSGAATGLIGMVRYVPETPSTSREGGGAGERGGPADPVDDAAVRLVRAAHPEVVVGPGQVQAWVVGSGGGEDHDVVAAALAAALADEVPLVLDADALAVLARRDGPLGVPALLTPHAGELARMLGVDREAVEDDQLGQVRAAAERFGCAVMLKGRRTLVAEPGGRVRVTTVGPPWLATAGAGDVLAGLCGALLAAGLDPFDAGSVGSWLHGAAATLAGDGGPLQATDVARAIPAVCRELLR